MNCLPAGKAGEDAREWRSGTGPDGAWGEAQVQEGSSSEQKGHGSERRYWSEEEKGMPKLEKVKQQQGEEFQEGQLGVTVERRKKGC